MWELMMCDGDYVLWVCDLVFVSVYLFNQKREFKGDWSSEIEWEKKYIMNIIKSRNEHILKTNDFLRKSLSSILSVIKILVHHIIINFFCE